MIEFFHHDRQKYNLDEKQNVGSVLIVLLIFVLLFTTTVFLIIDSYIEKKKNNGLVLSDFPQSISEEIPDPELLTPDGAYVEENSTDFIFTTALYDNLNLISCKLRNGEVFTVGANDAGRTNALLINPHITTSSGNEGHTYLVYASSNTGGFIYPNEIPVKDQLAGQTYLLTGRTYEHAAPACNLIWVHDIVAENSSFDNTVFHFRVIDVTSLSLIGTASCGIDWDGTSFKLIDLKSTDIRDSNDISEHDKEEIIDIALQYLTNPVSGILKQGTGNSSIGNMIKTAIAEHLDRPYFDVLLDNDGKYIYADKIPFIHPYAVTFQTKLGPVTVYVGEELEINGSLHMQTDDQSFTVADSSKYIAFGYDFLYPLSDAELFIPPTAKDILSDLQLESLY